MLKLLIGIFLILIIYGNSHAQTEYRISLSTEGLRRYTKAANLTFYSPRRFKYIATSYCAYILNLKILSYKNSYELYVFGIAKTNKGRFEYVTLCSTTATPTEKYGYLCDQLDMKFDRIEDNKIVCSGVVKF